MNCPNCEKEIVDTSKFCEFCGGRAGINKKYKEVIDKILKENPENKKFIQNSDKKAKYYSFFKKVILVVSVFVVALIFLENAFGDDAIIAAVPVTILVVFSYGKIAKKFNF